MKNSWKSCHFTLIQDFFSLSSSFLNKISKIDTLCGVSLALLAGLLQSGGLLLEFIYLCFFFGGGSCAVNATKRSANVVRLACMLFGLHVTSVTSGVNVSIKTLFRLYAVSVVSGSCVNVLK